MTLSSWYFGSESVYFDIFHTDLKLQRFKIIIKPDLSDVSLYFINMSEIMSDDLMKLLGTGGSCARSSCDRIYDGYMICEGALVYFWSNWNTRFQPEMLYTGLILTSAPFTNAVMGWNERIQPIHSLCPASGRFVYCTDGSDVVVADLF